MAKRQSTPLYSPRAALGLYSPKLKFQQTLARKIRVGSTPWTLLGAALWVGGIVRRAVSRREDVAAVERLKSGQTVSISTIPIPSKRQQRKAEQKAAEGG